MYINIKRHLGLILTCSVVCNAWIDIQDLKQKQQERKNQNAPNIVFILADDLGWNDIGYHHGSSVRTPFLDSLAKHGVKLENYYVQPACSPSRSQLLSGRYQIHTGLQHGVIRPSQPNGLPLEFPTLADRLKDLGYATHMVGKWHLGFYTENYLPTRRGFDSFYGYLTGAEDYFSHIHCWNYTIPISKPLGERCGFDLWSNEEPERNKFGIYSSELFAARAKWIIGQHSEQNPRKPLFMYLPFQNVHGPLQVPEVYTTQFKDIENDDRRKYAGMVRALDIAVEKVVSSLRDHDMWENTVLIFSTDNGGQPRVGGNNYPLRGWKGSHWEGGIRGVGFVTSPLLERSGVSKDLIHISDWLPTLVNLAGGGAEDMDLDGFDVWNTIKCGSKSPRNEILHNIDPLVEPIGEPRDGSPFDTRVAASLRVDQWKLITGNAGDEGLYIQPPEYVPIDDAWLQLKEMFGNLYTIYHGSKNLWLFDIDNDPFEENDLSDEYPEIVDQMLSRLAYWNSTMVPVVYPDEDPESDPTKHEGIWKPWINVDLT